MDLCASEDFPVRRIFSKADRLSPGTLCQSRIMEEADVSAEDHTSTFTDLLTDAAKEMISRTRISCNTLPKIPWFNDDCTNSIEER